jgi:hypothetical protein
MKNFILCTLILFTTSCGFKVLKQSELLNFSIAQIETTGDRKINFDLRNKLQSLNTDSVNKKINLIIETKKNKKIKEKNSKNEITKYLITVNLTIKIIDNENNQTQTIFLIEEIDYNVSEQNSQTINNEKQAIKTLSNLLFDKTIKEISLLSINDL